MLNLWVWNASLQGFWNNLRIIAIISSFSYLSIKYLSDKRGSTFWLTSRIPATGGTGQVTQEASSSIWICGICGGDPGLWPATAWEWSGEDSSWRPCGVLVHRVVLQVVAYSPEPHASPDSFFEVWWNSAVEPASLVFFVCLFLKILKLQLDVILILHLGSLCVLNFLSFIQFFRFWAYICS